ncbi:uncharacterized protein LOC121382884 [Gigantopelta aegis]|uniref:uncharacterized protein LOC121382884 n=1 Tax=Gigantopelta aegis TaxID=1735272 RepID=UPI001B88A079|nr:uncharacterized protein LOC121382884 [Gigantopelta aegis]
MIAYRCITFLLLLFVTNGNSTVQHAGCDILSIAKCMRDNLLELFNTTDLISGTPEQFSRTCRQSVHGYQACFPSEDISGCDSSVRVFANITWTMFSSMCSEDVNPGFHTFRYCWVRPDVLESAQVCHKEFYTSLFLPSSRDICRLADRYSTCIGDAVQQCDNQSIIYTNTFLDQALRTVDGICPDPVTEIVNLTTTLFQTTTMPTPTAATPTVTHLVDECEPNRITKCFQSLALRLQGLLKFVVKQKQSTSVAVLILNQICKYQCDEHPTDLAAVSAFPLPLIPVSLSTQPTRQLYLPFHYP